MAESARERVMAVLARAGREGLPFDDLMLEAEYEGRAVAFERLLLNLGRHGKIRLLAGRWRAVAPAPKPIKHKPKLSVVLKDELETIQVNTGDGLVNVHALASELKVPCDAVVDEHEQSGAVFGSPATSADITFGREPELAAVDVLANLDFLESMACYFARSAEEARLAAANIRRLACAAGVLHDD